MTTCGSLVSFFKSGPAALWGRACLMQAMNVDWPKTSACSEATHKGNIALSLPTKVSPGTAPQKRTALKQKRKSGGSASDKSRFLIFNNRAIFFLLYGLVVSAPLKDSQNGHTSSPNGRSSPRTTREGGREREVESRALLSGPLFANQPAQGAERRCCEQEIGEDIQSVGKAPAPNIRELKTNLTAFGSIRPRKHARQHVQGASHKGEDHIWRDSGGHGSHAGSCGDRPLGCAQPPGGETQRHL